MPHPWLRRRKTPAPRRAVLDVECLEDRTVPSGLVNAVNPLGDTSAATNSRKSVSVTEAGTVVAYRYAGQVYLANLQAHTTTLATAVNGQPASGTVNSVALSGNGQFLAFTSSDTNLVAGDTNTFTDLFVEDLSTGATRLVSKNNSGAAATANSFSIDISNDGRFIVFRSAAKLTSGSYSGESIYLWDAQAASNPLTRLGPAVNANVNAPGARSVAISGDGNTVAWTAESGAPGRTLNDILVWQQSTGLTTVVTATANADSSAPALSADGTALAFASTATNLTAGAANGHKQVLVANLSNLSAITFALASSDVNGIQGNGDSDTPSISGDGRYVAFASAAANLVAGDTNGVTDIFVKDTQTATITRASTDGQGNQANGACTVPSLRPSFSNNGGAQVIFTSAATNLVPGDTNGVPDTFAAEVNWAPTDITLSNSTIAAESGTGALIGSFSTTDPNNPNDSFTYTLVPGAGSTDNGQFSISGSQLLAATDFTGPATYSIRVRSTDQGGLFTEKVFTVTVTGVNHPPTGIGLLAPNGTPTASLSIREHLPPGTLVGFLTTTDPDAGNTFTYSFVAGGGSDNSYFSIVGNQLYSLASFDYATKNLYFLQVQSTDQGSLSVQKQVTVTILRDEQPPTGLSLSNATVAAGQPPGTLVATFSTASPNANDTFTYALVSGPGSESNSDFYISGNQLFTTLRFSTAVQSNYSILVSTTNAGGFSIQQSFVISITPGAAAGGGPAGTGGATGSGGGTTAAGGTTGAGSSSAPMAEPSFVTATDAGGSAKITVYNADGSVRATLSPFPVGFTGGVRVATGDVNGDGVPDIVAAAGPGAAPQVTIYDGVTLQVVRSFDALPVGFRGGVYVAVGDVNHDNYADIVVGAGAGGGPQVAVYSGKDGSLLRSFYAFPASFTGGVRVATGDVNGDGRADIVAAAGPGGLPEVEVYDGVTNAVLQSYFALPLAFRGGVNIAAGDVNGDGMADLVAGADQGGGPQVNVFDGRSAALLHSFYALPATFTGGVRVAVGNRTSDGGRDIIAAAGPGGGPQVSVFDGLTLQLLESFFAFDPSYRGGVFPVGS